MELLVEMVACARYQDRWDAEVVGTTLDEGHKVEGQAQDVHKTHWVPCEQARNHHVEWPASL